MRVVPVRSNKVNVNLPARRHSRNGFGVSRIHKQTTVKKGIEQNT